MQPCHPPCMHSAYCLAVIWRADAEGQLIAAVPCEHPLDHAGNITTTGPHRHKGRHAMHPDTAQVYEYIRKQPTPVNITQIAAATGLAKRSVLDRLTSLRRTDMVAIIYVNARRALYTAIKPEEQS